MHDYYDDEVRQDESTTSDTRYPLLLTGIALVVYVGFGIAAAGPSGGLVMTVVPLIKAVVMLVLAIPACLVTAAVLRTNFGTFKSAIVKLAAVATFPGAMSMLMALVFPPIFLWGLIFLSVWLLKELFEMEVFELIVFVLILSCIQGLVLQFLAVL